MDEGKLRHEVTQGEQARRVFENPTFKSAVAEIRTECFKQFSESAWDDDDTRRIARMKIGILEDLLTKLNRHMVTGEFAVTQLKELNHE